MRISKGLKIQWQCMILILCFFVFFVCEPRCVNKITSSQKWENYKIRKVNVRESTNNVKPIFIGSFFARGCKNTPLFLQSDWSIDFYRFLRSWTKKKVEHCSTFFSFREFFSFVFSSASKNTPNGNRPLWTYPEYSILSEV